jgi:hypothetical protein
MFEIFLDMWFHISTPPSLNILALFVWLISHQPALLFSQNEPAISNQPAVLISQNKLAPAINHQPNEDNVIYLRRNRVIKYIMM